MNENLVHFFRQRPDVFPLQREIDLIRFLTEAIDDPAATLPVPAKIFLLDEIQPQGFGFPISRSPALEELGARLQTWMEAEIACRATKGAKGRADTSLRAYRTSLVKLARNALHSSILADYHAVFWLVHSRQVARAFTAFRRTALHIAVGLPARDADALKYRIAGRWAQAVREALPEISDRAGGYAPGADDRALRFVQLILDNPLLHTEEFIGADLKELRPFLAVVLRRELSEPRRWLESMRSTAAELMAGDRLFRRAMLQLGYPDSPPSFLTLLDRPVRELLLDHPRFHFEGEVAALETISRQILQHFLVDHLRRGIVWMQTTAEGENVSEEGSPSVVYSRAIRPMNFGRRGVVEPIVYRYGLVYDITSFTQTLGEIARTGKEGEQTSYRQMLEFQRELAEITRRHALQFEKFLGDGAFYTSRRASRTLQAAVELQRFYSQARARGFAFNKGMRIALNYGYYRLLPMQVSTDGTEIKEFYGPGIVELSRLTTGKATKEIEDIQQLLISHGYPQSEVLRFFAPLSRSSEHSIAVHDREFYAFADESGHLVNEGIVASIPFLKQLSTEVAEERQKLYRLRAKWGAYIGIAASTESSTYLGIRILGWVSLKGIGNMEVAEVVRLTPDDAEVSVLDDNRPLMQILQQERHRMAATSMSGTAESDAGAGDLVICQSQPESGSEPMILVGEWDPLSGEVRRPIQLGQSEAEQYGLTIPLSADSIESHSIALQRIYHHRRRHDALPSFSVQAIRANANFAGYIVGTTIEPL
ncbi:MAG: hypothetical protein JWN02_2464 [Acidobacteria bacterium]|nr:hypothetical protein [Acidobacteriota bacterium]